MSELQPGSGEGARFVGPSSHELRVIVLQTSSPSGFVAPSLIGEFDPGSERTLAAGLTHASRTRIRLRPIVKWRTGA